MHAGKLLEKFDDNPFLENFYADPKKYAFHTQIYFLMARYRQQREIAQIDMFQSKLIADYIFAKDRIFAGINLSEDEFALYDKIFGLIQKDIPNPDLILYLQSDPELLYRRIKHRDRKFERNIEFDYIESLCEAYNAFFFQYNQSPVLIINIKGFDFIGNDHDLEYLCNEIRNLKERRRIISRS
jgi:deoxyadenosine/deoxycytidine kinase